ncbi:chromate efflux transporter [Enteractinococcus fodinae]|nr:chromate efflux transporter [Enteractinococcus fodinae]
MTASGPTEVFRAFLKLGVTSFGGPAAHLGYFRDELVHRRGWVTDQQYGQLVALCQFLPGPASSQVGFALGLIRGGYLGAFAAWFAFTVPSAVLLVLFAMGAVALYGPVGQGLLLGLKAVAVAVVAHAVWGMAKTLTPDLRRIIIGCGALALALFVPGTAGQLLAIITGLALGMLVCRRVVSTDQQPLSVRVSKRVGISCAVVFGLLLAGLPLLVAATNNAWVAMTDAFYRAGALVFGGGHVVLPLLQGEPAITSSVTQDQFLAGYGAAQAVPGPLFTFAAFLGFEMGDGATAWISAAVALVAVFVPGLLLLLAVLPFWNAVRNNTTVAAAMAGANAAVVGVLAAALITPIITSGITGIAALVIALGCFALLQFAKLPAWAVVLIGAVAGLLASVTGLGVTWG